MARTAKNETVLTPEEKLAQALVPVAEQPYQVPENWCWVYLSGILSEIKNGTTIKQDKSGEGYSVTRIESLQNQTIDFDRLGSIVDESAIKEADWYAAGDIALSHINSAEHVGKTALITEGMLPLVHGMNLLRLRFIDALLPILFQYYSQSFQYKEAILARINMAVNQVSINQRQIGSIEFPLPPLAEQQRIVDRIESLFAKLDEAKEKAQAVVDGVEDRKAAILHKAFTGELTADWRNTHGVAIDDWENSPLETVFQLRSGSTIDASEEQEYGAIPYVKVADMNLPENEIQITTSSRFVDECPESHVIPRGSTIFPKRGGAILTNKKRYVGVEKIIADLNTMAIMPIVGRAYGWYGYYWMQSVDLRQLNNGSNVPQINNKDMVKLFVPTPSIDEQKAIVGILDSVFDKEIEAKETAEKVIDQIDTMKKSILARAFRGELGTNDPADESAEELLKRVL